MNDEQKPKRSKKKLIMFIVVVLGVGFFIISYIIGSDPVVAECYQIAEEIELLAQNSGGITDEVATEYDKFIAKCSFMLDMDEQKRTNPDLYDQIEVGI